MDLQERLNSDVSVVNCIINSKKSVRIMLNRNTTRRGIGDTKRGFVSCREGKAEGFLKSPKRK